MVKIASSEAKVHLRKVRKYLNKTLGEDYYPSRIGYDGCHEDPFDDDSYTLWINRRLEVLPKFLVKTMDWGHGILKINLPFAVDSDSAYKCKLLVGSDFSETKDKGCLLSVMKKLEEGNFDFKKGFNEFFMNDFR